jgi:F0F1-type ATP synthase membrane subunit b/b'
MNSSRISRRTLLAGFIGAVTVALLAMVVVVVLAMGRLSEWGSTALDKVMGATATVVAQSGEEATRVLEETKGAIAGTEAARALKDARTSVERTREVIADPQAAIERAVDGAIDSATQEVTRSVAVAAAATAAAAAAASPAVTGRIDAAADALNSLAGPDPQPWPRDLALRQTQFRQDGAVAEYAYVSLAPEFDLAGMRRDLAALGYVEHVLALDASTLEAMYRGERQLLLTATLRDGLHHIIVRDVTAPATP